MERMPMNGPDPAWLKTDGASAQTDGVLALAPSDCGSLFAPLLACHHVLVAVSGGVDSTVLMVLLHDWAQQCGTKAPKLSVAVVDHALRAASKQEAEGVCALAATLALPAARLTWDGEKPETGVQAAAREARYRLLLGHAKSIGADALALAHHGDDQSETVLMRLCAGSGLDGLSGMRARVERDGVALVRPLLGVGKHRLVATARAREIPWIDDPSNLNDRFTRVRFRKARAFLAEAGLDTVRLNRLAQRMARAQDALEHMAGSAWQETATVGDGRVVLSERLFALPEDIRIRLVMRACSLLAPDAPQRLERFEALLDRINGSEGDGRALNSSVAGCLVRMRKGELHIIPEPSRRRGRSIQAQDKA